MTNLHDPNTQPVENIVGYKVTTLNRRACADLVRAWLSQPKSMPKVFVCANPHSLHVAASDPSFQSALHEADLVTPDGVGIVIASRLMGGQIRDRITGQDVFDDTCAAQNEMHGSCFFLGSTNEVLDKMRARLAREYPNLRLAGTYSPPFKPEFSVEDNAAMVAAINAAKPDVLWVGMTAPKQEKWISEHRDVLDVRLIGAVGAVFDFFAGTVKRSSPVFQRLGLEWLPRLLQQPRRLWRRNFVSNPSFLYRVLLQKLRPSRIS